MPGSSKASANDTSERSVVRRALSLGFVLALISFGWFLVRNDGLDQIDAYVLHKDRASEPVAAWIGRLLAASDRSTQEPFERALGTLAEPARKQLERRMRQAQIAAVGAVDPSVHLVQTLVGDPMVWANTVRGDTTPDQPAKLIVDVSDGDHATVSVQGGLVVRYARSGCRATDDPFEVVRQPGSWQDVLHGTATWRIARLPDWHECTPEQLRRSWRAAPSDDGGALVRDYARPPKERRLQLIQPIDAGADPEVATATPTASQKTLPRYTFDPENRSGPPEGITAWRTRPGDAIGTELVYDLGAPVHLMRIRLHNGANNHVESAGYLDHGRIWEATIAAGARVLTVPLPDTPDFVTIDCDFGVTENVTLHVDSVHAGNPWELDPAQSDVELSDIEFWGAPPPRATPPAQAISSGAAEPAETVSSTQFACAG